MEMEAKAICSLDYEREYKRVSAENAALKEKNEVLLEALMKIITEVL